MHDGLALDSSGPPRRRSARWWLLCSLLYWWTSPWAAAAPGAPPPAGGAALYPTIVAIRIAGNDKTRRRVIVQEMLVHPGDLADPVRIAQSRQAIMDLGLFLSVDTELVPGKGGQILKVHVREKHYFLPLPRLDRNTDGDITYGFDVYADNLGGLNQRLKLSRKTKNYSDSSGTERSTSLDYSYPRMFGTAYQLNFSADRAELPEATLTDPASGVRASYAHRTANARFVLSRWLNVPGPSRGWRFGGGLVWHRQQYETSAGLSVPQGYAGDTYGVLASASYYDVRDLLYTRAGVSFGYDLEAGGKFSGSDYSYLRHRIYYRRYMPVSSVPYRNVNVNLSLGLSTGQLFRGDAFALGGADSLRGYESSVVAGKAYVLANVEYLTPIFGQRALRGALFVDVGNAFPRNRAIDLTDLHAGGGLGLRWKLKTFVNVDLRLDVAYANSADGIKIYAGTKAPF